MVHPEGGETLGLPKKTENFDPPEPADDPHLSPREADASRRKGRGRPQRQEGKETEETAGKRERITPETPYTCSKTEVRFSGRDGRGYRRESRTPYAGSDRDKVARLRFEESTAAAELGPCSVRTGDREV